MATVYNVEIEIVSHWISYTKEDIEQMLRGYLEEKLDKVKGEVVVTEIKVKRN